MNLAMVVHVFYPEAVGDPFNAYELSQRQALQGDSIHVYTWSRTGRPSKSSQENLVVERLRGPNLGIPHLFDEYPFLPSLGDKIFRGRFDVVHAQSHLFLTSLQAGTASRKARTPFVVTVHGVFARRGFPVDAAQEAYLHTIGNHIFGMAARVVCLSRGDAREVRALGCPYSKIRVVPNAVDGLRFRPDPSKGKDDEVLWVGRFVPEKGIEHLVVALRRILIERKVKLRLVGDGPQRARVERLVERLGLEQNVIFQGGVDRNEVARLMSQGSLFVLPSVKEGLPVVLLEAMASELPVIASNIPGVAEVISDGQNGLLFQPQDTEALAKAVLTLLDDRNLARRLGSNARKTALQRYSWELMLKSLNRVYEEACDNS